jgi:hypothetical protein
VVTFNNVKPKNVDITLKIYFLLGKLFFITGIVNILNTKLEIRKYLEPFLILFGPE